MAQQMQEPPVYCAKCHSELKGGEYCKKCAGERLILWGLLLLIALPVVGVGACFAAFSSMQDSEFVWGLALLAFFGGPIIGFSVVVIGLVKRIRER